MVKLKKIFILLVSLTIAGATTSTPQHLSSARGIGLGAFSGLTNDVNAIDWNPAGLVRVRDWSFNLTAFGTNVSNQSSLNLYSIGVSKNFFNSHSAGIRFSPGNILDFIIPSTFTILDSAGNTFTTKFDQKINYSQQYGIGYGIKATDDLAIGFSAKYFETRISDNDYFFDNNTISSTVIEHFENLWTFNTGAFYLYSDWVFGFVFQNLFTLREQNLTDAFKDYQLNLSKSAKLNTTYAGFDRLILSLESDTRKNLLTGIEYDANNWLKLRASIHSGKFTSPSFEAMAAGVGFRYDFVTVDFSYLKFFNSSNRKGVSSLNVLKNMSYTDIDYTPFTTDRIALTFNVDLGRSRDLLAKIEYVEMMSEVFPASNEVYAFRPLGIARVKNISSQPIDAKVSFYIKTVMDSPTESKPYKLPPNGTIEIPFFAVFNNAINTIKKFSVFDGTVFVHAETATDYDDRYQTRVLVRGRNDWNGDALLLKYFLTPNDPDLMRFTRKVLDKSKSILDTIDVNLKKFTQAKLIFNEIAQHVQYIHDPKQNLDYVQFPSETISLRGGDCDDLTVCYSSMLANVGISSAFIDVVPPDNPKKSHIYLMFDSGVEATNLHLITENAKRVILRKNNEGIETIWIPVETTVTSKGFNEAWSAGSSEYFQDITINNGLANGWVRIIDLPYEY